MLEHPRMSIDPDELDSRAAQRRREPPRADAGIKDGRLRLEAPVEPRPQVIGFGERGVKAGERRVGTNGIVTNLRGPNPFARVGVSPPARP